MLFSLKCSNFIEGSQTNVWGVPSIKPLCFLFCHLWEQEVSPTALTACHFTPCGDPANRPRHIISMPFHWAIPGCEVGSSQPHLACDVRSALGCLIPAGMLSLNSAPPGPKVKKLDLSVGAMSSRLLPPSFVLEKGCLPLTALLLLVWLLPEKEWRSCLP